MQVVPYEIEYRRQVLDFFHDVPFKPDIWEWQFEENPQGLSFEPVVVVQDGRVVGFNGVMPAEVKYGEHYLDALWSCDFYVDERCRGQGVGKKIKEHLIKQSPLIMSFGVSPSAAHVLQSMGWRRSRGVYDYRMLRRPKNFREGLLSGLQRINRLPAVFDPFYSGSLRWSDTLPVKEEVDLLWDNVKDTYEKVCVRNFDYLNWKYSEHPLAAYEFLIARDSEGKLEGLLVVRAFDMFVRIIDYLGPASGFALKKNMVRETCKAFSESERFSCTTSDPELGKVLYHSGFFRARTQPSFFARSNLEGDNNCESGWFLMTGDSDGELLAAAAANYSLKSSPVKTRRRGTEETFEQVKSQVLSTRRLSEADFSSLSSEWQSVLQRSGADQLFMSWPWLYSWWQVWGERLGLELALFGAFSKEGLLVGIAPFYLHEFRSPVGLRVRRLHLIGNAWHIRGTVRTEYSALIAEKGMEAQVAELVLSEIADLEWHEIVACDQTLPELLRWQEVFDRVGIKVSSIPRMVDSGIRIPVQGDFKGWLSELGRNTRLKAYNRRHYLSGIGKLEFKHVQADEAEAFLQQLNDFHRQRWGKPCFDEQAVEFHLKLVSRLEKEQFALTSLEFNGKVISVLYDVCAGECRYNLQAGYFEDFDPKVALGTLHLGYAIESSFGNPGMDYYDLLAGHGKKSFYKSRFNGEAVHFLTVQFARHPLLRSIYSVQSRLPERFRQALNRLVRL
jgi:GNAT superfamily N-acetyltransferase